ncbi:MAG: hypothetical protein A4E49_01758 [Methanosaeta sp. PtaU1.Bin112]|nr:MAG: hypothetical protein A4E49_01758 [Methanosaeta sp. PtaU1.Bin112]
MTFVDSNSGEGQTNLKGGIDTKKAGITLLLIAFLTSIASAEYTLKDNLTLEMTQSVTGTGYFMNYKYAKMPNTLGLNGTRNNGVEVFDYSHGSGSIDTESVLSAEKSDYTNYGVAKSDEYEPDYAEALSCIQLKEDNAMTYSPITISVGTGFYASMPLYFNSLIKEKSWLKNRGSATVMHHEVEYAHALDKELEILAKDFISEEDPAVSMMNITEDMTEGRAHIGLLQGDPDIVLNDDDDENTFIANTAWKKPLVDVDEDYWGTYHIEKLMNLTSSVEEEEEDDDWLPCCSGGYLSMPEVYQMGSKGFGSDVKGIFDCTCFKAPTIAEFPRV